jgi:membrane protease YdiL (CAAX protease family)
MSVKVFLFVIIIGVIAVLSIYICFVGVFDLTGLNDNSRDLMNGSNYVGMSLWLQLFSLAFFPAIAEELIFRGMLMGALRKVFTLHVSVVVTALCFGLIHGTSIPTVAFATGMGLILGYTLVVSGSLQNCILVHMIYNAVSTFRAMQTLPDTADVDLSAMAPSIILASVILMLIAAGVLALVVRWYYKEVLHATSNSKK